MNLLNSFVRITVAGCLITPAVIFSQEPIGLRSGTDSTNPPTIRQLAPIRQLRSFGLVFGNVDTVRERFALSEEQLDEISKINERHKQEHFRWLQKISPIEIALEGLLMEPNVDISKIRKLLVVIGKYTTEIRINQISHRLAIEKVLTQDQKSKIKEPSTRSESGFPVNLFSPERIILPIQGILH
ncbi:Spy/CpxP family protein refolding chaperone [Leptospira sp. WS92.C1]